MRILDQWEAQDTMFLPHYTPTGLVENLQAEVEALKDQARHMQRQLPKPKKKPKEATVNGGKQKNQFRKPQLHCDAHSWEHAHPRPYQTANQNQDG